MKTGQALELSKVRVKLFREDTKKLTMTPASTLEVRHILHMQHPGLMNEMAKLNCGVRIIRVLMVNRVTGFVATEPARQKCVAQLLVQPARANADPITATVFAGVLNDILLSVP